MAVAGSELRKEASTAGDVELGGTKTDSAVGMAGGAAAHTGVFKVGETKAVEGGVVGRAVGGVDESNSVKSIESKIGRGGEAGG